MSAIRRVIVVALFLPGLLLAGQPLHAQRPPQNAAQAGGDALQTTLVQGNVYLLVGAGANITVQVGTDSVLLVDTGLAPMSDRIIAAVRSISPKPVRYIVNTSFRPEHTGGNEKLSSAGTQIGGMNIPITDQRAGAAIIAHEKLLNRLTSA